MRDRDSREQLGLFRQSARLRREAGNPPDIPAVLSTRIRISGEPTARRGLVTFRTSGAPIDILVFVSDSGAVMDDCANWDAITDEDRREAMGTVLHHLLADPALTRSLGLDAELLAELYTVAAH